MRLSDFDYHLPEQLIAHYPLPQRSASRLLRLDPQGDCSHHGFVELLDWLKPEDLLVFNNTRVIPARLYGSKDSGGKIEALIERILDTHRAIAHVKASKSPKAGQILHFQPDIQARVVQRHDDLFELEFLHEDSVLTLLNAHGEIPLPTYFNRRPEQQDLNRYQTVYAKHEGAVAAPTAGLHFDAQMMWELDRRRIPRAFVTLHVGAGTFQPVRVEDIRRHQMHAEYAEVSEGVCQQIALCKSRGGRIIAVGTTSARALESAASSGQPQAFQGDTRLFIYPGYQFNCVDVLITNFHLPKSSLLMMVTAFAGYDSVFAAYQTAIKENYRFYSYGDAMWLDKTPFSRTRESSDA